MLKYILKYIPWALLLGFGLFQSLRASSYKKTAQKSQEEAARLANEKNKVEKESGLQKAAAEIIHESQKTDPSETERQIGIIQASHTENKIPEEAVKEDGTADYMAKHWKIRNSLYRTRYNNEKK